MLLDNMDLEYIVTEFEFYYEFKFGKKPKLSRKLSVDEMEYQNLAGNSLNQNKQARRSDKRVKSDKNNSKLPSIVEVDKVDSEATIFEVQGSRISNNDTQRQHPSKQITSDTQIERYSILHEFQLKVIICSRRKQSFEAPTTVRG